MVEADIKIKIPSAEKKIQDLSTAVDASLSQSSKNEENLRYQQEYDRRNNLEIHGIPYS